MTTAVQIGETARDRADFCRCFKAGAAVLLHDGGMAAHCTYRDTLSAACPPAWRQITKSLALFAKISHALFGAESSCTVRAVTAREIASPHPEACAAASLEPPDTR